MKMNAKDVVNRFQELRASNELCDYSITTCDGHIFNVHKSFIAVTSDYFYAMLNKNNTMLESSSDHVTLQNITAAGLRPALDSMYGMSSLNIRFDCVADVLNAAAMLHITRVTDECESILVESANEENYFEIRRLCVQFDLKRTITNLDMKISRSGILYNIMFSEQINEVISQMDEELFLHLLKPSNMSAITKFKCINRFLSMADISEPHQKLNNYVFFLFTFLLNEEERGSLLKDEVNSDAAWFCGIESDSASHLALPMHRQMLVKDPCTAVQQGVEGLFVIRRMGRYDCVVPSTHDLYHSLDTEYYIYESSGVEGMEYLYCNGVAVINNYAIYVMSNNTCHVLNPRNMSVCEISPLPEPYTCRLLLSHQESAFAVVNKTSQYFAAHIMRYSACDNAWSSFVTELPVKLHALCNISGCVYHGKLYITGTRHGNNNNCISVMCVDPLSGHVTTLPELELPHLRVKLLIAQGKLCVGINGHDENGMAQYFRDNLNNRDISCKYQIYEFNRNTSKWSLLEDASLVDSNYSAVFRIGHNTLCVADRDSGLYDVKEAPSKLLPFSGLTEVCQLTFPEIIVGPQLRSAITIRRDVIEGIVINQ